ncbi:MAG TPA: rhodanese-like domain-containing protein, partial [Chthoniobacterales bacterium]
MNYPVILFYKYVAIAAAEAFAARQRAVCQSLDLKGRVLIATEGINGTLAGPADRIDRYLEELKSDPRFSDIEIKWSSGDVGTFPKLVVKVRPEIVTLNAGAIPPDQENHLSPVQWKQMMEENPEVVLLDIRNRFESDAGKFSNAVVCDIEHFRELPKFTERLHGLKDKTILMYCTGGIRCEKASTLFKQKGFRNVFQLHGGIAAYQEQFGNEHWEGE